MLSMRRLLPLKDSDHDPDERVALPLDPEDALRALLAVKPDGPVEHEKENQPDS